MIERCVTFGPDRALVGIVSDPGTAPSRGRPAVIFLNAGLIHRVGPNRLHVRLARQLADQGYVAMRIDLSGRGDSDARRDDLSFAQSGIVETQDAMSYLSTTTGIRRFVLMGICSGAFTAGDVAYLDGRVVGAAIIEGPTYPTPRFRTRYYRQRLFRRSTWWNTVTGTNAAGRRLRRMLGVRQPALPESGAEMSLDGAGAHAAAAAVAPALRQMVDRGVEMLAVFSGSTKEYNYAGQLHEAFSMVHFAGRLQEEYFADADHTFTRRRDQDALIGVLLGWINARFSTVLAVAAADEDADSLMEQAII